MCSGHPGACFVLVKETPSTLARVSLCGYTNTWPQSALIKVQPIDPAALRIALPPRSAYNSAAEAHATSINTPPRRAEDTRIEPDNGIRTRYAPPASPCASLALTKSNTHLDYLTLLPRLLPPSLANPLLTLVTTLLGIFKMLQSHLSPLLTRLVTQPDVASILALLAILFISLKILDMAYRAVLFWVKLVVRLVVWATVLGLGLWLWNRGVDGFVADVGELAEYWGKEYSKYAGEVKGWSEYEKAQIRLQAYQQGGRGARGWW